MRGARIIASVAVALLVAAGSAYAGYAYPPSPGPGAGGSPRGDASVNMNGNPFSGGLAFDPAKVKVAVGARVVWTNTDSTVPHNAVEDHNLWRVDGDYGEPISPGGLAPGESKGRKFDAGTFHYFCEIHPQQMRGVVKAPVTLKPVAGEERIRATWGAAPPPQGLAFDVQRRKGNGPWKLVEKGTRDTAGTFAAGQGRTRWSFRARLRDLSTPDGRSGWSPRATISVG